MQADSRLSQGEDPAGSCCFSREQVVPYAINIPMKQPLAMFLLIREFPCISPLVALGITANIAFVKPFAYFPLLKAVSKVFITPWKSTLEIGERLIPAKKNSLFTI